MGIVATPRSILPAAGPVQPAMTDAFNAERRKGRLQAGPYENRIEVTLGGSAPAGDGGHEMSAVVPALHGFFRMDVWTAQSWQHPVTL